MAIITYKGQVVEVRTAEGTVQKVELNRPYGRRFVELRMDRQYEKWFGILSEF